MRFICFLFSLKKIVGIKRRLWVTYEREEKFMQGFGGFNLKETDHLEELDVERSIVL